MQNPKKAGQCFTTLDIDAERSFFQQKSKKMTSKLTTVKDAVAAHVHDGDYLAVGGFGSNRIPTSLLHEIVRQGRKELGLSGHTATHDGQILSAGRCYNRCDAAYVVGLEARGLSRSARNMFESGEVEVNEWTNAALAWRYRAAAMGIPFIPSRIMMGSDTFAYSGAETITCPYTGTQLAALPALYPDVALIHVHRADEFGNCQIDGILISDNDIAKASKRVIITTEELIDHSEFRKDPNRTIIPYWCVDAVIRVPFGGYPGNMAGEYFSDEEHLAEWLRVENDPEEFEEFLDEQIFSCADHSEYLAKNGGEEKMSELRERELYPAGKEEHNE